MEHSGERAKIYSPLIEGEDSTLYDQFVEENRNKFRKEVANIDERLYTIGHKCGLLDDFFDTKSGKFGENLCTFKDRPGRKLRLYFTEFDLVAIILGGGGEKPSNVRATQDKADINFRNRQIGEISLILQKALKAGHFTVYDDGSLDSTTNFTYDSEDYK
ncbi:MAG: hypothetical protein JNK91_14870 [Ferruginibacter sp.]|nr:hypothetical protein [Ferruginibacter sp.]